MAKKKELKKGYLKVVLTLMFVFLLLFVTACLYINYKTGNEPSTLIASVFTFCTVEGGLGAWIKTTKEKNKRKEE